MDHPRTAAYPTAYNKALWCKLFRMRYMLLLVSASLAWGQGTTASVLGEVTDATGAVLAKASVTATHVATGANYSAVSDSAGRYAIPLLPLGEYRLKAELPGFKTLVRQGLMLQVDQTAEVNIKLEVGEVSQNISITATTPAISTETTDIGSVVDNKLIAEMPLNGRLNIVSLLVLAPGVQDFEDQSAVPTTGINPQIGGGGTHNANFTLDGVSNTENNNIRGLGDWPSLEAIQEFKVVSSNGSAQFGQGGAQVMVVSKSGTNQLHGSLLWYNRNRFAAAQNALVKLPDKPAFNRNEYGGSIGGPVRLPHYNGKDRTFFFFAWEGFKLRSPVAISQSLPTAAMHTGNFNGVTNIKDPLSGAPFPNNQIPSSLINPYAATIASFYPLPNIVGPSAGGLGVNFVTALKNAQDVSRYSIKIDHRFSNSDNLSARYLSVNLGPNPDTTVNAIFNVPGVTPVQGQIGEHVQGVVLNETHVLSPRLINEFKAAYRYQPVWRTPREANFDPATVLPGMATPAYGGLPDIVMSGFTTMTDTLPGSHDKDYELELIDDLTYTKGAHLLKFGYHAQWVDHWNLANISATVPNPDGGTATPTRGNLTFANRYTGTKNGNAWADFLLGDPTFTAKPGVGPPTQFRSWRQYAYIQDDWRINSTLTLNLGLRYEYEPVYNNKFGLESDFAPALGKIVVFGDQMPAQANQNLLTSLPIVLAKNAGLPSSFSDYIGQTRSNLGPRLGFAWAPVPRFVIRGGYGMFYDVIAMTFYKDNALVGSNPPFNVVYTYEGGATSPTINLSNPFPGSGSVPSNPTLGALAPGARSPMLQQWNMTFEYEALGMGLRASYAGNRGEHELGSYDLNAVTSIAGAVQPRRPYQPFSTITWISNPFSSNLNQLQLGLIKAYRGGFSVRAQFQYTRALGIETYDDPFNGRLSYGNLGGIRRFGLVNSYVYELPFGSRRRWLNTKSSNTKSVARAVAGGWELTGIPSYFSGAPYQLAFSQSVAGCPTGRPNFIGNPVPANRSVNQWFNPAAFSVPTNCSYGNEGYNSLFGPNTVTWNTGLFRNVRMTERFSAQIRAEAFNVLNHPVWGTPRNNISSSSPGQITSTSGERQMQFAVKVLW
jgi:hypothetical protein